jgi:hypothetical protein
MEVGGLGSRQAARKRAETEPRFEMAWGLRAKRHVKRTRGPQRVRRRTIDTGLNDKRLRVEMQSRHSAARWENEGEEWQLRCER